MYFAFTFEYYQPASSLVDLVSAVGSGVRSSLCAKSFGIGLDSFFVGIIIYPASASSLHPERGFSYKKRGIFSVEGERLALNNVATMDVSLDYERLMGMSLQSALRESLDVVSRRIEQAIREDLIGLDRFRADEFLDSLEDSLRREFEMICVPAKGGEGD